MSELLINLPYSVDQKRRCMAFQWTMVVRRLMNCNSQDNFESKLLFIFTVDIMLYIYNIINLYCGKLSVIKRMIARFLLYTRLRT